MFKQRLMTFLLLVPLVFGILFFAPVWLMGVVIILLVVLGGFEWLQLIPIQHWVYKLFFMMALLLMLCLMHFGLEYWVYAGFCLWILILASVLTYPASQAVWGHPWIVALCCLLLLPLFAHSFAAIYMLPLGKAWIVYLIALISGADIGAYIFGKWFGKHKLLPKVSPGKSVEGFVGGIMVSLVVAVVAYRYFSPSDPALWFALALIAVMISVLGDLFVSILKRRRQIKDTGNIFPGHGGILDRLDSQISAAPLFYFGLQLLMVGA